MSKQTTIALTKERKQILDEVKEMLESKYGTATYGDVIIHLHRFWKQNRGKENRDPEQVE